MCSQASGLLGLYPSTVRFRIVGQADEASCQVHRRALQGTSATHSVTLPCRVSAHGVARAEQVTESLAITEMPMFVICADEASTVARRSQSVICRRSTISCQGGGRTFDGCRCGSRYTVRESTGRWCGSMQCRTIAMARCPSLGVVRLRQGP